MIFLVKRFHGEKFLQLEENAMFFACLFIQELIHTKNSLSPIRFTLNFPSNSASKDISARKEKY